MTVAIAGAGRSHVGLEPCLGLSGADASDSVSSSPATINKWRYSGEGYAKMPYVASILNTKLAPVCVAMLTDLGLKDPFVAFEQTQIELAKLEVISRKGSLIITTMVISAASQAIFINFPLLVCCSMYRGADECSIKALKSCFLWEDGRLGALMDKLRVVILDKLVYANSLREPLSKAQEMAINDAVVKAATAYRTADAAYTEAAKKAQWLNSIMSLPPEQEAELSHRYVALLLDRNVKLKALEDSLICGKWAFFIDALNPEKAAIAQPSIKAVSLKIPIGLAKREYTGSRCAALPHIASTLNAELAPICQLVAKDLGLEDPVVTFEEVTDEAATVKAGCRHLFVTTTTMVISALAQDVLIKLPLLACSSSVRDDGDRFVKIKASLFTWDDLSLRVIMHKLRRLLVEAVVYRG